MEFEKIALSALLCKFPLEELGAIIAQAEGDAREADKSFFNDFRKVARWENAAFTESEMEALEKAEAFTEELKKRGAKEWAGQ